MKRAVFLFLIVLLSISYTQVGCAQQGDEIESIKKEIKELKEGQEKIIKDIHSIKRFIRMPEEFKEAVVNIADRPFKGDINARVTLIEFTDYQ